MKKLINIGIAFIVATILAVQPQISLALNFNTFFSENDVLFYDPDDEEVFGVPCVDNEMPVTELVGKDNREKIWNYFMSKGLTKEQTAGVLANFQAESGFSPGRQEDGKTWPNGGYGIAQFTDSQRTDIYNHIKDTLGSDFLNSYYHSSYGGRVYESDGFVPSGMPIEANDKLLLAQLNYLLDKAKSETIYKTTANIIRDKGWLDKDTAEGDRQWDALKKQKTIKHATTLWLYERERPGKILTEEIVPGAKWGATDETALATIDERAEFGEAIYNLLKDSVGVSIADDCIVGEINPDKLAAAKKIIELSDAGKISWDPGIKVQITNIIEGKSDGNSFGNGINIFTLNAIIAAATAHNTINVTSINRSENCYPDSGDNGRHACGNGSAVDFNKINGVNYGGKDDEWNDTQIAVTRSVLESISNVFKQAYNITQAKGLRQSWIGQDKCDITLSYIPASIKSYVLHGEDTCHHIHMDFQPLLDPDLACKPSPSIGGSECY